MAAGRCSRFGVLGAFLFYVLILTLSPPKFVERAWDSTLNGYGNPVEANVAIKFGGKHFGYGKSIVAATFVFPSLMTSFKKRIKERPVRKR